MHRALPRDGRATRGGISSDSYKGKEIVALTGETSADLRPLEKGDVIVCAPSQVRRAWLDEKIFC
jgi:hypothetical protein